MMVVFGDQIDQAVHARVVRATESLRSLSVHGVSEIVPAYTTLALWYDPLVRSFHDLAGELDRHLGALAEGPAPAAGREWTIPVRYHGPDLADVAERTGLSADEVVARHAGRAYQVYLLGFVPGFAYLGELDPALVLPRRASPRQRVPAGSVAIAGAQTAVYPLDTPGGWHLIGQTDLTLFDPSREPAALLRVGDTVRFEPTA
jgi:KipI family sensor histidine kinase inhibitor